MIDHVILNVSDYDASRAFYEAALAPLGFVVGMEFPGFCGFDRDGKPWLWIAERPETSHGTHVAIRARSRDGGGRVLRGGDGAGGRDNGPPGVREHYHPDVLRGIRTRPRRQQHRGG